MAVLLLDQRSYGSLTPNPLIRQLKLKHLAIGGLLIIAGIFFFNNPPRASSQLALRAKIDNLDLPGAILFIFSLTCLFTALQKGGSTFSWLDIRVWGWILGFSLTMVVFVILQIWLKDR